MRIGCEWAEELSEEVSEQLVSSPGSLLLMEGAVQEDWLHCLPKVLLNNVWIQQLTQFQPSTDFTFVSQFNVNKFYLSHSQ